MKQKNNLADGACDKTLQAKRRRQPRYFRILISHTLSRMSSTTLSGVEAPEVTPILSLPSGSHPSLLCISRWEFIQSVAFFPASILSAVSSQNEGMLYSSAISCRWHVLLEL